MFWNYRKCHEWLSGNNFQKYAKLIDMVVQSLENLEGKIWKSQEIILGQGKSGTGKVGEFYWKTKNNLEMIHCYWKQCFFISKHPQSIHRIQNCSAITSGNFWKFCLENLQKSRKTSAKFGQSWLNLKAQGTTSYTPLLYLKGVSRQLLRNMIDNSGFMK